jgi:hypothetical protein
LDTDSKVTAVFSAIDSLSGGGIDLCLAAADGNLYLHSNWQPADTGPWRKIEVGGFKLAPGADFQIAGGNVFGLSVDGALWMSAIDQPVLGLGMAWQELSAPGFVVTRFAVGCDGADCHIAIIGLSGDVWVSEYVSGRDSVWVPLDQPDGFLASPYADLVWTTSLPGRWDLFTRSDDGLIYSVERGDVDLAPAPAWSLIGGSTTFVTKPSGGLAAVCRAKGQIEVFGQASEGALVGTWFS